MLSQVYFEILRCPQCRGSLTQPTPEQLTCRDCGARYPVVENIPVLIADSADTVSQIVQTFYASQWKRNAQNQLQAKVAHEDLSDLGQRYIQSNEDRFQGRLHNSRQQRFFLDAGCGAQPRVAFGAEYEYHICLDFSLDGLSEAREQIGARCLPIVGSLLEMPLLDGIAHAALASHCIYHIDAEKQAVALTEFHRVMAPGAPLLIFYANPGSLENRLIAVLSSLKRAVRPSRAASTTPPLYYKPLPIATMEEHFQRIFGAGQVQVEPLRCFSIAISRPVFRLPLFGALQYALWTGFERSVSRRPGASLCTYVSYLGRKAEAAQTPSATPARQPVA